jgi:hypothetical protein
MQLSIFDKPLKILWNTLFLIDGENYYWALNKEEEPYHTSYINFPPHSLQEFIFYSPEIPQSFYPCLLFFEMTLIHFRENRNIRK